MDGRSGGAPARAAPGLVAVVVTHNRLAQLRVTLGRLLDSPAGVLAGVVVVDNLSGDGTGDWLAGQGDPRLVVLRPDRNLGGAGGFEAGMRLAVDRFDPDWLVVMDDDARPHPGTLAAFAAMDRTGWDALAAAVHYPGWRGLRHEPALSQPVPRPAGPAGAAGGRGRGGRASWPGGLCAGGGRCNRWTARPLSGCSCRAAPSRGRATPTGGCFFMPMTGFIPWG